MRGWKWALMGGLGLLPMVLRAATFSVTTTADSGAGSFRQAILNANATSDLDTIQFQLPGTAPFTISPVSALPPLAAPVVVDATTQAGYVNRPIIELNGSGAGSGTVGLRVTGGGCTIRGLAINRFSADGIRLDSPNNVIQGNYIGTDVTGSLARGNGQYGIFVLNTATNLIGGTTGAARNVISGRNDTGIYVLNGAGNIIQGNYLGLNAAGSADLGNTNNGIVLYNAPGNLIGGAVPGARNVIAGNDGSGVNVNGAAATGNWIQGNYIGVNAAGTVAVGNTADGITLNGAPGNVIGGTNADARNLISGNGQAGIFLNGAGARDNLIAGNWIGTDASGAGALGNAYAGVTLSGAVSNRIGGTVVEARNVISGNRKDGVFAYGNSLGNRIQGNFIGVNASGTGALTNLFTGVTLENSSFNLLGGSPDLARSVISGNGSVGVWIHGVNARSNAITGNLIGTGVGGTNALGNFSDGLKITDAASNQIGGNRVEERNVLSGNGFSAGVGAGISVENGSATGNVIRGNFIGTDITGQTALANRTEGIYLIGARSNVIGGELAGAGNLISGNTTRGIRMTNSSGNEIRGNFMGTRADGIAGLGNGQFNVELEANCNGNSLGGLVPGAGNRIGFTGVYTGGPFAGVRVRDLSTNNAILGNAIFSNSGLGIAFSGASATANDNCDADTGGNLRQNFPVLTQAFSGVVTTVSGTLNSQANTRFRIQFFSSTACDAAGNGEGQRYLGDTLVTTDGTCSNSFSATLPVVVAPGNVITATATDPANNTSEFSACATVQAQVFPPAPRLAINLAGNQVSFAWTNTATCFVLQATDSLSPPIQWAAVTNAPVVTSGQFLVTSPRQAGNHFYRLYSPCAAPPPAPLLEINRLASNQISLAWPLAATGFVLKETDNLSAPVPWTTVTNAPAITNGQLLVTLPRQAGNRFYRLSFE